MPTQLNAINQNVHQACGTNIERVQADLDKGVYDFFFRHVICWTHGSRQAIINYFFQRLYEECQELGIPAVWDEDNGQKMVEILNRLNFKEQNVRPTKQRKRPASS